MYFNYSIDPFIAVAKPENEDDDFIKSARLEVKQKIYTKFGYYQLRKDSSKIVMYIIPACEFLNEILCHLLTRMGEPISACGNFRKTSCPTKFTSFDIKSSVG